MNIFLCDIIINNPPTTSNWFKDYGSIIGSSITIILFIAGFIINKLIEKNKEKKRLLEIENHFKMLIHLLRKPLIKQCDALVKFSHILKNKKDLHFDFKDVSDFHVEEIKRIDDKDLFIIFIQNKNEQMLLKTELFSKIKSSIDYINRTKHSIPKDLKDFGERFEIHQKEYYLNLETIEDIFRSHYNVNEFIESRLFFMEMSKIREEWANPKNDKDYKHTDKYISITKFVEPLQLLCEKHISEQIPKQIFKHVMLCNYAYDNMIEVKKVYREIFINQARGLQKKLFELDETIKKFDSIPKKQQK